MNSWRDILTLAILFVSLYYEIFLLVTYIERRKKIHGVFSVKTRTGDDLPRVTVIVPCFNEEHTVSKTLDSLLALEYPQTKLKIVVVNDGSTDNTLKVLESYRNYPHIEILNKENGGKHTALNLALQQSNTEFVGCLDADSYARPDSLARIIMKFDRPEVMAVVPSLQVFEPKTLIQKIQKVEYVIGAFMRAILAEMNALYVTPGPFSIFRREVFEIVGYYRKAHNTEDMEMAMRMQVNGMHIASAHDAVVYTSSPRGVKTLYKQRVRWTSGFLNNARDYKHMLFNLKYGNIGMFVMPFMIVSSICVLFVITSIGYDLITMVQAWYLRYSSIGLNMFEWSWPSFNWFYIQTTPLLFCGIAAMSIVLIFIILGSRISTDNKPKVLEIVPYVCLYSFIAPLWVIKSLYNVALQKKMSWR
ncbi:MAG: glycosyltransferase family 2 protein [Candidatus Taylorbacteria bacterium]